MVFGNVLVSCFGLPLQKRGEVEKSFSRAERGGGGTKSFEVVLIWELLAIVMGGGARKVSIL